MKLYYGDLLKMADEGMFDVLVHGCNCFCNMGAGIAKAIKEKYPEAYEADLGTRKGESSKLGNYSLAKINRNGRGFTIVNAYTQYNYGRGDKFSYVTYPLLLSRIKTDFAGMRIGMPLIGCGHAGGNEEIILGMVEEHLEGADYKVVEINTSRPLPKIITEVVDLSSGALQGVLPSGRGNPSWYF